MLSLPIIQIQQIMILKVRKKNLIFFIKIFRTNIQKQTKFKVIHLMNIPLTKTRY